MKKGFTLVELLAVIVIIAILSIVIVPIAISYMDKANYKAFESGAKNVFDTAKIYVTAAEETGDLPLGGLKIEDLKEDLKNYNYISGTIYRNKEGSIYIENISDGVYCATGTKNDLKIIKGTCENLDLTPPSLKLNVNSVTSSSVTIIAKAIDNQSGILGYAYSIDGINYTKIIKDNIYTVKKLKANETLTIYVKVYNNKYDATLNKDDKNYNEMIKNSVTEEKIKVTTLDIEPPIFKLSSGVNTTVKILEIIYPKREEGYKYVYQIDDGTEEIVNEEKARIVIERNMNVTAKIYYDDKIITNKIRIEGLDNEGPKFNVSLNDTIWEKNKRITIDNISDATGLPSKPYSFDGGRTWQKEAYKIYDRNQIISERIFVRDKLGNISKEFTVNNSDSKTNQITITHIDNISPKCEIKEDGPKGNDGWYIGNVYLNIITNDWTKNCGVNGANCEDTHTNENIESYYLSRYSVTENTAGTTITGTVIDKAGNKGTCKTVIKLDKTYPNVPTITANDNIPSGEWHRDSVTLSFSSSSTTSGIYYQSTYSGSIINGSSRTINSRTTGSTLTVKTCTNAGLCSSSSSYLVKIDDCKSTKVSYNNWSACSKKCDGGTQSRTATYTSTYGSDFVCSTKTESQSCNTQKCTIDATKTTYNATWNSCKTKKTETYTTQSCHSGNCGACSGGCSYEDGWEESHNAWCDNCCCDTTTGTREVCVGGYECKNGGSLSGQTCTKYTCPSGYKLNGVQCNYQ